MKKLIHLLLCLGLTTGFFTACNEPEDAMPRRQEISRPYGGSDRGVFVLNEGNFGWGYGTVDFIDLATGEVADNIYEQANGSLLGNVVQSASFFGGYYYIVVNNSQKVVAVHPQTFTQVGEIDGLISPRYFLGIDEEKAYVTDLYADAIHIINPSTFEKTGEIAVGGRTEQILLAGNYAIVASTGTHEVLLINTETDEIEKSISLEGRPNSLQLDKENYLWVLTGTDTEQQAHLYRLSLGDFSISQDLQFTTAAGWPGHLAINSSQDTLYYLYNGVYQMSIQANELPASPIISETDAMLFYGLDISPEGHIWLADALDYVQRGWARQYSHSGAAIDSFRVGVIPNSFLFQ